MSHVTPIGGMCACRKSKTTHYIYEPGRVHPIATKCAKCADEMKTLGWMTKRAEGVEV